MYTHTEKVAPVTEETHPLTTDVFLMAQCQRVTCILTSPGFYYHQIISAKKQRHRNADWWTSWYPGSLITWQIDCRTSTRRAQWRHWAAQEHHRAQFYHTSSLDFLFYTSVQSRDSRHLLSFPDYSDIAAGMRMSTEGWEMLLWNGLRVNKTKELKTLVCTGLIL